MIDHSLATAELLEETLPDIAVTAVEHSDQLDLTSLVNDIDLYRWHVAQCRQGRSEGAFRSFPAFVADAEALARAADGVTRESVVEAAAPVPLDHGREEPREASRGEGE